MISARDIPMKITGIVSDLMSEINLLRETKKTHK